MTANAIEHDHTKNVDAFGDRIDTMRESKERAV
jgi:hypothetical protein